MGKKKSSAMKLDSLYAKLEIPQEGKVPCFGHTFSGIPCTANPKQRKDEIESILHDIIDTIENGWAAGSDEVKALLVDLAERLTCEEMHHDHLVPCGRSDCGKHKYVAFVLGKRLKKWDKDSNGETPESARSNTPTVSNDEDEHVEGGNEDYDDERWEDEYEDEDDDEKLSGKDSEEDDEEVTKVSAKESTKSSRQRPELHRETAMIDKTACVTPIKQRGRPGRNSRPSTPRTRQPVGAFDSLSVMDEGSPSSPELVISPGVSEVFSPASTVPTPMSIPDSDIRPRRSRYSRGEDESPTRRRRSSKGDDLLDGAWASKRVADKDTASGQSRTSEYCNKVTTTREQLSRKGNKQLDQSFQLDDQDSDSQRQTEDGEEHEERPIKVGNMSFRGPRPNRNPLRRLRQRLEQPLQEKSASAGWIYCFAEKTAPGYLKIGYKQYEDKNANARLSRKEQNDTAQVMKRLRVWERECQHDIDYKFIFYMPYAVQTMEALIHRTLHKSNKRANCPNPDCTKDHREWFEISEMEARRAVEVWQQFSDLEPYTKQGQLKYFWHNRTRDDFTSYSHLPVEEWVYERWVKVIVPAAVERKKQISELQEEGARLAERRREVQERKKELELEIQNLTQRENKVREELAELQIQH